MPPLTFCDTTPLIRKRHQRSPGGRSRLGLYNQATQTTSSYTVTAVLVHQDPIITTLTISGEQLITTPEHPFYVLLRGWVAAADVPIGASVRRADGTYGVVQQVTETAHAQVMYNLTVADAHTFFVGAGQWLVHNTCLNDEEAYALQRAQTLAAKHRQTVASTGTYDVHSGWSVKNGFVSGRLGTDRAIQLADEMGITFPKKYGFNPLKGWFPQDGGVAGQHYASHAEVQMAAMMYYGDIPKGPIAVSQDFCSKGSCVNFLKHLAKHSGEEWVIINPTDRFTFLP